jgi:hypothetical protein
MRSGRWDVLMLDEVNNAVHLGLLDIAEVLVLVDELPEGMDLVLTGRDAPQELVDRADIVSEVVEVKHPHQQGQTGKKGIEWELWILRRRYNMKRIILILVILAALVYWQWPTIAGWWEGWQADRAAQELLDQGAVQEDGTVTVDDELDPELNAIQNELDGVSLDARAELDALEQEQ